MKTTKNICNDGTPCYIPNMSIVSIIGNGKHSIVYKYIDKFDNNVYAIKKILKQNKHIYLRELEFGKRICSRYFPLIYSKYECHLCGGLNILMEYLDGYTLENLKKSKIKIPFNALKTIIYQLLMALKYLKNKNILHNDVKPSNIILLRDGTIKLIDFGSADDLDD